jgi:hypothetical protein
VRNRARKLRTKQLGTATTGFRIEQRLVTSVVKAMNAGQTEKRVIAPLGSIFAPINYIFRNMINVTIVSPHTLSTFTNRVIFAVNTPNLTLFLVVRVCFPRLDKDRTKVNTHGCMASNAL